MNFTLIYAKVDLLVRNFDDNILLFWQLFLISQTYYVYHIISQFSYTKIELCWYQHSDLKYAWIIIILIKMLRHTYLIRYIKVRPHFGYSRPPPTVCAFVVCIQTSPVNFWISSGHLSWGSFAFWRLFRPSVIHSASYVPRPFPLQTLCMLEGIYQLQCSLSYVRALLFLWIGCPGCSSP